MPLAQALSRQLAVPGISVLALPRPAASPLVALALAQAHERGHALGRVGLLGVLQLVEHVDEAVFGIGESLFAVPWNALAFDPARDAFVLERLEQAGGFDRERWPAMADAGWARAAHRVYRVTPYWEP